MMDEERIVAKLTKEIRRQAGTWALPRTDRDVLTIAKVISSMARGDRHDLDKYPQDMLHGVLGDDTLFDALDKETDKYLKQCATVTKKFIKNMVKGHEKADYKDPESYDKMEELAGML
jgi:hypothetical protein